MEEVKQRKGIKPIREEVKRREGNKERINIINNN